MAGSSCSSSSSSGTGLRALGTLKGHTGRVSGVCWVGGDRIASASYDGTLKLWSVSEQRMLGTFEGHTGVVRCVCWLGDGRIASGSDDSMVKIWDIETRACLQTLTGNGMPVYGVWVLGDGRLVSGSFGGPVKAWSVATGACMGTFEGHTDLVRLVAGLQDGRIVSASGQACLGTLPEQPTEIRDVVAVGEGRIVSAAIDGTLKLWNVDTQACLGTFSGHTGGVCGVAVLGLEKIISCGQDRTLRVWDVNTQACCGTYPTDHTELIWRVAVLPDGLVVTASWDNTLKLFDSGAKVAAGSESMAGEASLAAAPLAVSAPTLEPTLATPPLQPAFVASHAADVQALQQQLQTRTDALDVALVTIQRLTAENTELRSQLEHLAPLRRQQQGSLAAAVLKQRLLAAEQKYTQSVEAVDGLQRELDHCKYLTPFSDANEALVTQTSVINHDLRLEPIDRLGEGSFGTVFSAARVGDDRVAYCLKRVPLRPEAAHGTSLDEIERKIMQEGQLVMDIGHPNIVRYHTIYSVSIGDPMAPRVTTRYVCIGMELCGGGSLASLTAVPSPAMMREICLQTMQGLAVLHARVPAVRHGDLKPENICLMCPLGAGAVHVKLTDFGLADDSTLVTMSSMTGGTVAFWSPERLARSYSIEDDVWGAAMSLLFVGVGLCSSAQIAADLGALRSGDEAYQPRLQAHLAKLRATHGNALANVLAACLTWERNQRCSARAAFVALKDMKEP